MAILRHTIQYVDKYNPRTVEHKYRSIIHMENLSFRADNKHAARSNPSLIEIQTVVYELDTKNEQSSHSHDFNGLLLDAVDEGLGWLGNSAKKTIYRHLETCYNIKRKDIPSKVEVFTEAIEEVFGGAAALLEIQIMKKLHEKVGRFRLDFQESQNLLFTQYIEAIRLASLNKLN